MILLALWRKWRIYHQNEEYDDTSFVMKIEKLVLD